MNAKLSYRDETRTGPEVCRELCDGLMRHQAGQTDVPLYRELFGAMNYENRLRPSFDGAAEKQLITARDGETPIGYVFSSVEIVDTRSFDARPDWTARVPGKTQWFYPDWLPLPSKIGELGNLYVRPKYRDLGIGRALMERAMAWLREREAAEWLFVYVAHGNPVAPFYERYGFAYSHEVLGGMITAYCRKRV